MAAVTRVHLAGPPRLALRAGAERTHLRLLSVTSKTVRLTKKHWQRSVLDPLQTKWRSSAVATATWLSNEPPRCWRSLRYRTSSGRHREDAEVPNRHWFAISSSAAGMRSVTARYSYSALTRSVMLLPCVLRQIVDRRKPATDCPNAAESVIPKLPETSRTGTPGFPELPAPPLGGGRNGNDGRDRVALELVGLEPQRRTLDRKEAAALLEVLQALQAQEGET